MSLFPKKVECSFNVSIYACWMSGLTLGNVFYPALKHMIRLLARLENYDSTENP